MSDVNVDSVFDLVSMLLALHILSLYYSVVLPEQSHIKPTEDTCYVQLRAKRDAVRDVGEQLRVNLNPPLRLTLKDTEELADVFTTLIRFLGQDELQELVRDTSREHSQEKDDISANDVGLLHDFETDKGAHMHGNAALGQVLIARREVGVI